MVRCSARCSGVRYGASFIARNVVLSQRPLVGGVVILGTGTTLATPSPTMLTRPFGQPDEKGWRAQQARPLTANPWFRVLEQQVTMPSGKPTTYYSVDFAGPAVGVVPRRPGEILLVRQYRFLVDQFVWAIPSGGVGKGEEPAAAALREMEEETGHRAVSIIWLQSYFPSYGCGNQRFELFVAEGVTDTGRGFDRNEVLEVRWFTEAEIGRMLSDGDIVDGLSLAPLLLLAAREGWLR